MQGKHDQELSSANSEQQILRNMYSELSSYPMGVTAHREISHSLMSAEGPLPRDEREWLAMETAIANENPYCYRHHLSAFEKCGGNQRLVTRRMELLKKLASVLSKSYWKAKPLQEEFIVEGFTEAEWQHAVMIVSFVNFSSRCAHALDVELEADYR